MRHRRDRNAFTGWVWASVLSLPIWAVIIALVILVIWLYHR